MSELICEICEEMFGNDDKHERAPRILKCGHTFCTKCLKDMANRSNDMLCCPLDRTEACKKEEVENLIINRAIYTVLEKKNAIETKNTENDNESFVSNSSTSSEKIDYVFKVITLGDIATGKTCLSYRYTNHSFSNSYLTTINLDILSKVIRIRNKKVKIHIWDTSGSEKYQGLTSGYIKGAHGVAFIFDLTQPQSFINLSNWMSFYNSFNSNEKCAKVLIGNKKDSSPRMVEQRDIEHFVREHNLIYFETSAKTGENVKEAFDFLVNNIFAHFKADQEDNDTEVIVKFKKKKKGCC